MTISEAYQILQVSARTSKVSLHRTYLRMKEHHPDNSGSNHMAMLLNEAYGLLLRELPDRDRPAWDARIIDEAFCERPVYEEHTLPDGKVYPILMAEGKYLWNPEAEDFSMLMKSVYEVTLELAQGRQKARIFHYLMQEFVDPLYFSKNLS